MFKDIISKEDAKALLDPHFAKISAVLQAGWNSWQLIQQKFPDQVAQQPSRTRASWVNGAIAAEARKQFQGVPGVEIVEKGGILTLTFANRIVMRFNKFRSGTLKTSGAPTLQRRRWCNQELALPEMSVTGVVAGYLHDRLEQHLVKLAVVCPYLTANEWDIPLPLPAGMVKTLATQTATRPKLGIKSSQKLGAIPAEQREA